MRKVLVITGGVIVFILWTLVITGLTLLLGIDPNNSSIESVLTGALYLGSSWWVLAIYADFMKHSERKTGAKLAKDAPPRPLTGRHPSPRNRGASGEKMSEPTPQSTPQNSNPKLVKRYEYGAALFDVLQDASGQIYFHYDNGKDLRKWRLESASFSAQQLQD